MPAFLLFPLNPEKLIEGLKSPETALLLPDILPLADPFGSTSDAVNGKNKLRAPPPFLSYVACLVPHDNSGVYPHWALKQLLMLVKRNGIGSYGLC